ncbi:MAG: ABC transporter ATP-binding protein [Phycisphaerae bacterium]|nr:ABC transporter ATP-binding protein [Phycisphaerae bacterium]
MELAIRCRDVHKRYVQRKREPVHALRGLDLEVRAGECFGLLGPNGAGKTTAVEILEGLRSADSGEVEVLGMRWGRNDLEIRQRIGIALQQTRLADKLTAIESLHLFGSFYNHGRNPEDVLALVGLQEKRRSYVEHLSGGQHQRLAVACALVSDPDLLFLDEPTTGLDPQARRAVWDIVRAERQRGCTILLTTHYMDEAEKLCDRVAVIDQGRAIALGTPRDLILTLGGDHVIEFEVDDMGSTNGLDERNLAGLSGVNSVGREGAVYVLNVREPHISLPGLIRHLEEKNRRLAQLTTRHASLEDVFVNLTGRHLRDDDA